MNFSSPSKVASQIDTLKQAELTRAPARALVDMIMNGYPPFTEQEAKENQIHFNCNFGSGPDLLLQGRQQLENAFLTTGNFFSVKLPDAPLSKREDYEGDITRLANRVFKKSLPYLQTQRQKLASIALHGPGPQMWHDDEDPIPSFVAVPDLLIPTDTDITLCDCNYFAVRRRMKPGQLYRKTFGKGKNVDPGWNLKLVKKLLTQYKEFNQNAIPTDPYTQPEAWQEQYKQNLIWFEGDKAPSIWFWDFYWQEDDQPDHSWMKAIVLDSDYIQGPQLPDAGQEWVYHREQPFAENISQILHVNFNDGNNVPPFMYHSCRGLGIRLYDPVQISNRLQCQFLQKVFEDMMLLFRANDPSDKARLDKIFLGMLYGVIPEGLEFVKRDERYQFDPNLIQTAMAQLKQQMGEGSAAYVENVDTNDRKERTAFEVNTLLQQATKMTSSMLNLSYLQETFAYDEMCRRLCKPDTHNFLAKKFQNECREHKIPDKWLQHQRWVVESERVMGGGNSQVGMAQAQALLNVRPLLNPRGQDVVMNRYVFQVTQDPALTAEIAPMSGANRVSETQHDTEIVFDVMMGGRPVSPLPSLNPVEVLGTMVPLMEATTQNIMQSGGVGTPQDVMGLMNANRYCGYYLNVLAQDKSNKQVVKQFGDRLGRVMNDVKAFSQRQQQAAQKQAQSNGNGAGVDPQDLVKSKLAEVEGAKKIQRKDQAHQQKLVHKQQDFVATQQQKKLQALNDISLKTAEMTAKPRQTKPSAFDEQ